MSPAPPIGRLVLSVPELSGNHSKVAIILALAAFDQVDGIDVNMRSRQVLVELSDPVDEEELVAAVRAEGYFCTVLERFLPTPTG